LARRKQSDAARCSRGRGEGNKNATAIDRLLLKENALENSITAVAMSSMDGTITYVNKACVELWGGGGKEELLGKPYWRLLEYDEAKVKDIAAAVLNHQSWRGELVGIRNDGTRVPLHVQTSVVRDADGNPVQTISSMLDLSDRKQAEEALRESEQRFRRLVEDMNDGYCVLRRSKVMFANARSAEMFGYTQEEVIGRDIEELLTPEAVEDLAHVLLKRRRGEALSQQYETRLSGREGELRAVELGTRVIEFEGSPALSVVIRDISERKRAEDALRASEEHYSALVASLTDAVFRLSGGTIVWCNNNVTDIYGYGRDELIGEHVHLLYPLDAEAGEIDRAVYEAVRERGCYHGTAKVRRKDGGVVDIEYSVSPIPGKQPIEFVAVARDITQRMRMEEALRHSEDFSRGVLETAATGIYLLQDGRFEYVNRLFEEISGYSSDELLGMSSLERVHPEDRETVRTKAIEVLKGQSSLPYEFRLMRKDSGVVWVLDRVTSIHYKGKRSVLGTLADITERKHAEAEILAYTRQIETLFNIAATVSQTLNLSELLDSVLERVLSISETEAGGIFLLDGKTNDLVLRAHCGVSEEFARRVERITVGEGFARRAARARRPIVVGDLPADAKFADVLLRKEGVESLAAIPIMVKDRFLGVVNLVSNRRRDFSDREVRLLEAIASQIGVAVENAQLYEQALELAFTDGLTGLYNRRYLMEQIEREFSRARRNGSSLTLIMLDLDGLKNINDRYGHHHGDSVLSGIGKIIKANTRLSDVAARWGGDEFMLLTPDTDSSGAHKIGDRIRSQVERFRPTMDGVRVRVSISVGIASCSADSYSGNGATITQLLQRADEAMYEAKSCGGNRLCTASPAGH
jgi:diguanylate cyclase (GGDEF)-like protein/PAS domain S-box-containing protein